MKNNYGLLNAGNESSIIYDSEYKCSRQKSNNILKYNFRKYRRNNSVILKSNHKKYSKKTLITVKHNSLLNDIKKISPQINLKYQIELYEQKGRYSLIRKDEIIDEKKYSGKNFIKKNFKDSYRYRTCIAQRGEKKFYTSNIKSKCYGKFRPLSSKLKNNTEILFDKKFSFKNNNKNTEINNNSQIVKIYNDKNILRPKSSTKQSTILSCTSRPFSTKKFGTKNNKKRNNELSHLKKKCIRLKYEIDKTFDKASNASVELNKDIYESRNYDNLNKLNEKKKKEKNKISKFRIINGDKEKKEKAKKKERDDLYKYLDIEKNVENKIIKSYKYFDNKGKRILKEAMEQDKMKQNFLNKNENSQNIILNSRFFIKKLQNELGILGANILATKKKYKGERAIEPNNEIEFLHKLIKENMFNYFNSDDFLNEIMKRKNVYDSMSNKIKKRLLSLQQKSLSKKNKLRENDYYL